MKLTAQVTGLDTLAARVRAVIQAGQAGLKNGAAAAAAILEAEAKIECPVVTGALQEAIHTEATTDTAQVQSLTVTPAYDASNAYGFEPPYARRVNEGFIGVDSLGRHYHQPPDAYMARAWDSKQDEAKEALTDAITTTISGGQ